MIRDEVKSFVTLGPLPDFSADQATIDLHQQALEKISAPISNEEALALLASFGSDDSFGLAWRLLHLIETAPDSPLDSEPEPGANEWLRVLWGR